MSDTCVRNLMLSWVSWVEIFRLCIYSMVLFRPWRTFWRSFDGEWNSLLVIGEYNGHFFHCMWRVKHSCKLAKTSACIALYYRIQRIQRRRLTCRLTVNIVLVVKYPCADGDETLRHHDSSALRHFGTGLASGQRCVRVSYWILIAWRDDFACFASDLSLLR